jgi:UDP-N-acetylglucosamine diphosphorylase/glucosamine-1-phosphate N-acetyltransferase
MNFVVSIMAAGKGTRMKSDIPKVLHSFCGQPMIIHIIKAVKQLNPREIIIIVSYDNANVIKNSILKHCGLLGIRFVTQNILQGTSSAVKCCLPYYNGFDKVLILNGDMPAITTNILRKFINTDLSANILTAKLDIPHGYGRVIFNGEKFIKIVEEKDCTEDERDINIVNVGVYYITAKVLKDYMCLITNNNAKSEYYLTDLFGIITANSDIVIGSYKLDSEENKYIHGVNTPQQLLELQNLLI